MWAVGWNGSDASKGCVGAAAAALIAALAAACAGRADAGSGSWRELRTNRVIMVTDVDSDTARKRLETVDRLGAAMSSIYAAIMQRPASAPQQIRVVHLADCDDLTRRFGETARGAVTHSLNSSR